MKTADPGDVIMYNGGLYRVIGKAQYPTLTLRPLDQPPCPTCGSEHDVHVVEQSPNFQEGAEAVPTLRRSGE